MTIFPPFRFRRLLLRRLKLHHRRQESLEGRKKKTSPIQRLFLTFSGERCRKKIIGMSRASPTISTTTRVTNVSGEIYTVSWGVCMPKGGGIGWLKKGFFWHFQHYQDCLHYRFFNNENYRQCTTSEQILKAFGQSQNCQN